MSAPTLTLAVAGKGGSGKTVLVSLLARALAERGLMVLAVDLDSNPGLALSLGLPASDSPLPDDAVEEDPAMPYGWGLARHLTPAEAVRRYALPAGERTFFLGFGNTGAGSRITRHLTAVRQVAEDFDEAGWAVVADLASGPNDAFEGYARFASLVLVVVEPTAASVLTAKRLLALLADDGTAAAVVATKVGGPADVELVHRELDVLAEVAYDAEVRRLERDGSLARLDDASPALAGVRMLAERLTENPPSHGRRRLRVRATAEAGS